jgi:DNA-binding response OmpR family regulator
LRNAALAQAMLVPVRVPTALIIVEHEPTLRMLVADVVSDEGLASLQVDDRGAALELIRTRMVDVIVIYSPDRDLIHVLGALAPVVAIVDPQWHWAAAELGISAMVPLVFDVEHLQKAVRGCLPETQADALYVGPTAAIH